jgi:hypothetical protein
MENFASWLAHTSVSDLVQRTLWLIPVLQTIHIIAVAMVWSSVGMIELRILGVGRSQTMAQMAHRFIPWIWVGIVVLALTGAVLIVGEPDRWLPNPAFQLKMAALMVAVALRGRTRGGSAPPLACAPSAFSATRDPSGQGGARLSVVVRGLPSL